MIYRKFGATDKLVSVMGMGGSRFRGEKCVTEDGIDSYVQLVLNALDMGINYFDTSPGYGCSEDIFGRAFSQTRHQFYIATKSTVTVDPTADDLRRRLETSLSRLHVNKINFYNMWNIMNMEMYEKIIRKGGPLEGALKAQEEGLIEHICFSAHCSGSEIARIIRDGYFEGVTLGYNAINFRYREEGLEAADKAGIGVAIMNPLGGGVIPASGELFEFLCEDGYTLSQSALRFAASQKGVTTVLSGFENESEMMENLKAFSEDIPQDEKNNEVIKRHLDEKYDHLCTGCQYCAGCPQGIDIHQIMLSYNQYYLRQNNYQALKESLWTSWTIPQDQRFECIECGKCEAKCTQHLPIINRIKEINSYADEYINRQKEQMERLFSDSRDVLTGVYAIGPYAQRMFDKFQKFFGEVNFPIYLFDSDSRKWGTEPIFDGIPVRDPREIKDLGIKKIIIASENNFNPIYNSLKYLEKDGIEILGFQG